MPGKGKNLVFQGVNNGFVVELLPEISHSKVKHENRVFDYWNFKGAGRYGRPGQPWLPVRGMLILAPLGTKIHVETSGPQVKNGVLPLPIPRLPMRNEVSKPDFTMDKQAYTRARPWPGQRAWLTDRGMMGGIPVARLVISPMEFSATRSRLTTWNKIKVTVTYPSLSRQGRTGRMYQQMAARMVRGMEFASNKVKQDRYLVIVADELVDFVSDWAAFRQAQGIAVDVVPISVIGVRWDKIQAFIKERYFSNQSPDMVLLVGDSNEVPPAQGNSECKYCPSDFMYSLVDGDDWYPDLTIGRWSAQTPDQVIDQANRDILYETMPGGNAGPDFLKAAVVISSSQGEGQENDDVSAQGVIDMLEGMGYQPVPLFHSSGTDTVTNISQAINRGAGLVYYYGHGAGWNWATTIPQFTTQDVGMLNNHGMTPFIMDISCLNGNFTRSDGDCLAEAWVHGGGLADFASTSDTAWLEPTIMAEGFTMAMQANEIHLAGVALYEALAYMIQQEGITSKVKGVLQQYVLFGDPGQVLYTSPPVQLDVDYPKFAYKADNYMNIQVQSEDRPVKDALITLNDGDNPMLKLTDVTGLAKIDISTMETGDYSLFVRAKDALPFYGRIRVIGKCPDMQTDRQVYSCVEIPDVTVFDKHADKDPTKAEIIYLQQGDQQIEAMETGPDTGVFRVSGFIPASAADGQVVTWTYKGAGACGDSIASITLDCKAPSCNDVRIQPVTDDRFGLLCRTNEPARLSVVVTGPGGFSTKQEDPGFSINHHLNVRGVQASTTYNYSLKLTDHAGNTANGPTGSLTTAPCRPKCLERKCGDDGCGGQCGECLSDQTCEFAVCAGGAGCEVSDTPGCGGCVCEDCACKFDPLCCSDKWDATCVSICRFMCDGCGQGCMPQCQDMECGPDHCGGSCGKCQDGWQCVSGNCVESPKCGDRICDPDENCSTCSVDCVCAFGTCKNGTCVCQPLCQDMECGPDHCGGSCGKCKDTANCVQGKCVVPDADSSFLPDVSEPEPPNTSGGCNTSQNNSNTGAWIIFLMLFVLSFMRGKRRSKDRV